MMMLLLVAVTFGVVLLPMLPALAEWRRPSDVAPLRIDPADALDPPSLARNFAERLRDTLDGRHDRLGHGVVVHAGPTRAHGAWPLRADEAAAACNHRLWHVAGDAQLPDGQAFLAEVVASGALRTAEGAVHHALFAGQRLKLNANGMLLRWAHGRDVEVARGCRLAGRVSAERMLVVHEQVRFTLLHAPVVRFAAAGAFDAAATAACAAQPTSAGRPQEVVWDDRTGRGIASGSLDVAGGHVWDGDLVCHGSLRLGHGCRTQGSLKAHGALRLDAGCSVDGSVFAEGLLHLKRGCRVGGVVASETAVVIGPGCVIGAPGRPATVTAPRVAMSPGAMVHGTVWATEHGFVRPPDAATRNTVASVVPAPSDDLAWTVPA